jgi:hypothetical protein
MEATMMDKLNLRSDRVRAHTQPEVNQRIDEQTARSVQLYATADHHLISQRLDELDQEWDIERLLQTNAASVSLLGIVLGTLVNRKWFVVPAMVAGFLLQHAVKGWCPPLPILRRRGFRTRKEIERERTALRLLRGDFQSFDPARRTDVNEILRLVGE